MVLGNRTAYAGLVDNIFTGKNINGHRIAIVLVVVNIPIEQHYTMFRNGIGRFRRLLEQIKMRYNAGSDRRIHPLGKLLEVAALPTYNEMYALGKRQVRVYTFDLLSD